MKIQDFNPKALRLAIGADHGGFELKEQLVASLQASGITVMDKGPAVLDPADDYPVAGSAVARAVSCGDADCGILVCRSGAGMGIVANRFHGVRAVVAASKEDAVKSRNHNASNVLVLSGDKMSAEDAKAVANAWINTPFSGDERHVRRLTQAEQMTYDDIAALRQADPEIAAWIDKEAARQSDGIELIASENFTSCAVRAAQGSILTNKYAEGYPAKRYYGGCEFVDEVETLAIERAKQLFGAEAANVQPHAGSQANMAVYFALLNPGDTVLAMSLDHGGHLTHGFRNKFLNYVVRIMAITKKVLSSKQHLYGRFKVRF